MKAYLLIFVIALLSGGFSVAAHAQAVRIQIGEDQRLMFEAASKMTSRDYKAAEDLYTKAIAINGGNIDAWLQRGLVRREMGDAHGTDADARMAVQLANNGVQNNPNNSLLHYQRGMGYRLLKIFPAARQDIQDAVRLGGNAAWDADLKAIDLEEKLAASQATVGQ